MLTAVATVSVPDAAVTVHFAADEGGAEAHEEVPEKDLNPIFPELKEVVWGFGSFIVFALVLRYALYPKLRKSMDARYFSIREGHEQAEKVTDDARAAVAQYEAQLVSIRGEAQQRIEAARSTLDAERSEQLAAANTRIAEKRAAAATEAEQLRMAVEADVESAVRAVAARAGELATGQAPDPQVVSDAVAAVMSAGVSR
ncbi:MAG: ATP synthase F0 subunit B [Ilumatobacteraceae bacterium]